MSVLYPFLPAINACLNALSAVFLIMGYRFIRQRKVPAHHVCMLTAFILSVLFLISYLLHHAHVGHVRYQGQGAIRAVYFAILTSHTILAVLIVPLVLRTLYLAFNWRIE